ncbi:hypothetical protein [Paenibacillus odorifer]|uniref:hypothetical protein n=1 Tax=Paenibacillus odorifer TaxID=189426 RepID=UPI0020BF90B9|nr:hypothetical protein [Paenibacillus odorifer]
MKDNADVIKIFLTVLQISITIYIGNWVRITRKRLLRDNKTTNLRKSKENILRDIQAAVELLKHDKIVDVNFIKEICFHSMTFRDVMSRRTVWDVRRLKFWISRKKLNNERISEILLSLKHNIINEADEIEEYIRRVISR